LVVLLVLTGAVAAATGTGHAGAQGSACKQQELNVGIVIAKGCFAADGKVNTATSTVELNGFGLEATPAAPLTIDTAAATVSTGGKEVGFTAGIGGSAIRMDSTAFDFEVPGSGKVQIAEVDDGLKVADVIGIPIVNGAVPVSLVQGEGRIDATVELSGIFRVVKNASLATDVTFDVVPGKGVVFDGVKLEFGGFKAGPFAVKEVEAEFSLSEKEWGGSLEISLPPDGRGVVAGFKIKDEKLVDLKIGVTDINLELVDGVFLQKLIGELNFDGRIAADLQTEISAGPEIDIFGEEVSAVAVDGDIAFDTGNARTAGFFGIGGSIKVVRIQIASVGFRAYFSGAVRLTARFGTGFPKFTDDPGQPFFVGGELDGWIKGKRYEFDGTAELKAAFIVLAKGEALISDRGAAVCGVFLNKPSGGGAYSFRTRRIEWFPPFTCNIGKYRDRQAASSELAASGSTRLALGRGHRYVRLIGGGAVPAFRLEGPGGRAVEHRAGETVTRGEGHVVVSSPENGSAHVVLDKPRGNWTLRELEEGPSILRVEHAGTLPDPRVAAEVRGRGTRRTLVWDARKIPGQSLRFNEVTPDGVTHPITRTRRSSGRMRFEPLSGDHYGKRGLEVGYQQRHTQRKTEIVDRYRVNRPALLAAPRLRRADRLVPGTVVGWRRVPGARGYRVSIAGPDGEFRVVTDVGRRARAHTFQGIVDVPGTVARVRALNRDGRAGRADRKRVRFTGAVANRGRAAKRALRLIRMSRRGNLKLLVPCPRRAECKIRARVRTGGSLVGRTAGARIPAGAARRITIPLEDEGVDAVSAGRGIKVGIWVSQFGQARSARRTFGRVASARR